MKTESHKTVTTVTEPAPVIIHLKNILVPLDLSARSLKALRYAVNFAGQFGARLTLLHVVEPEIYAPDIPAPPTMPPEKFIHIKEKLREVRSEYVPEDIAVHTAVRYDFPFDAIMETAREIEADLIIVTTHGHTGLKHILMGSTAEKIVRHAPCPVLVVRERPEDIA